MLLVRLSICAEFVVSLRFPRLVSVPYSAEGDCRWTDSEHPDAADLFPMAKGTWTSTGYAGYAALCYGCCRAVVLS